LTAFHTNSAAGVRRENENACRFSITLKETTMPPWDFEPSRKQDFLKRRSFDEGYALIDAAHDATRRLYCDVLRFWRGCSLASCKRHRRCCGDARQYLMRGLIFVPQSQRLRAQQLVIAGGPRRAAPASHAEWYVRRSEFKSVVTWPES
jgi:hypothetical protein